ncbi:kinase-like protein [Dentipellis sp. KUC8613]|nr:kinase-like protein [Dentipellis sp. KUC8613]
MPYIPHSLTALLASPRFSSQPYGVDPPEAKDGISKAFSVISKGLIYQLLGAIAYLHEEGREIAHRDIKPSNILLCENGCLKLIDFGIAFGPGESNADKRHDLWPEDSKKMYFEVGTGPYRAPELLFGPKSYDALAADRWALGATIAEFFTSLHRRNVNDDDDDWDSDEEDQEDRTKAYILDPPKSAWASVKWGRCPLFDSSRGDLGLIWSIFSTRGTPNTETWPSFKDLPDATKVTFTEAEGVDLASLLPNMPLEHRRSETSSIAHCLHPSPTPKPLDLIHRFLVYPQASRLKARDALVHPWFQSEPPVLLPSETASAATSSALTSKCWDGKSLGDWLRTMMTIREDHRET